VARGFVRRGEDFVAALTPPERVVIAQLAGDVIELLAGDDEELVDPADGPGSIAAMLEALDRPLRRPADPALMLLLPDATADPELADEFRRFTEDELRHRKVRRLLDLANRMLASEPEGDAHDLHELVVASEDAAELAAAMTDVRLVLASRLGIGDDAQAEQLYRDLVSDDETGTDGEDERVPDADDGSEAVRRFVGAAFTLLGALQESLTDCLIEGLPARPPGQSPSSG